MKRMEDIRREIEKLEESARKIREMAGENRAIARNAEIILTFANLLKFITPPSDREISEEEKD